MKQIEINQETQYGIIKKGISFYPADERFNRTKNIRIDGYKSKSTNQYTEENVRCINENDLSDQQIGGYDSNCYSCYVGCAHTVNKHNKSINLLTN